MDDLVNPQELTRNFGPVAAGILVVLAMAGFAFWKVVKAGLEAFKDVSKADNENNAMLVEDMKAYQASQTTVVKDFVEKSDREATDRAEAFGLTVQTFVEKSDEAANKRSENLTAGLKGMENTQERVLEHFRTLDEKK